jgi:hypothetical protein
MVRIAAAAHALWSLVAILAAPAQVRNFVGKDDFAGYRARPVSR